MASASISRKKAASRQRPGRASLLHVWAAVRVFLDTFLRRRKNDGIKEKPREEHLPTASMKPDNQSSKSPSSTELHASAHVNLKMEPGGLKKLLEQPSIITPEAMRAYRDLRRRHGLA
jgi:hypothetical protein